MTERFDILLVEDRPEDAELAMLALHEAGVDAVKWVKDGEEALDFLYAQPEAELPRLVLLDLNMPKMGGLEVLESLVNDELLRRLPIVVLSGSVEQRDLRRAYDLRVSSYLLKPVGVEQFMDTMKLVATYWLGLNRYWRD